MYKKHTIAVIIPVLNEQENLPGLLSALPSWVDLILVSDNGSSDGSWELLQEQARSLPQLHPCREPRRGYGNACLRAMQELQGDEIVVFLDGDQSDDPALMPRLLDPIIEQGYDTVISNRFTPALESGAMGMAQRFGNKLAVFLIRLLWGYNYRDLGPFRSIRGPVLQALKMADPNYGWTIELQVKAIEHHLRIAQVDVPYRARRLGRSKVGGSLRGILGAGSKILYKILQLKCRRRH